MTLPDFAEMSIELTHNCSLKCVYCSSDASLDRMTELDAKRVISIIDEAKRKFHITTVSLSGGEALHYTRFDEIYSHLRNQGFEIKLYTSGVVLDGNGRRGPVSRQTLEKIYINDRNPSIVLNIQGHTPELIERINGVVGSYPIIDETIRNLQSSGIRYCAHVVPFKYNYMHLYDIYEYCRNRKFSEMRYLRFVPQGRGNQNGMYNSPLEFKEIMNQISKIIKKGRDDKGMSVRLGCPINFLFLLKEEGVCTDDPTRCRGGMDAPLILPSGDVSMCPAWKDLKQFVAGNIYRQDFEEIWGSDIFKTFRRFIQTDYSSLNPPCRQCEYLALCRGKCVAQRLLANTASGEKELYKLLFSAPDPQCFANLVQK
jgi:radical SAM protein with 4Fe4S-binding SPASM domain